MKAAIAKIEALSTAIRFIGRDFAEIQTALDEITASHTSFPTFRDLLNAPNYRPSLLQAPEDYYHSEIIHMTDGRKITAELRYAELDFLALAYNMAQKVRGDHRLAFRS